MGSGQSKNQKILIFGVSVLAACSLIYLGNKNKKTTPTHDEQQQQQPVQIAGPSVNNTQHLVTAPAQISVSELAKGIKLEYGAGNTLTLNSIMAILEKSLDLVTEEYQTLTSQNRKNRRSLRESNPDAYIQLVTQYNMSVETLLEAKQEILCQNLNVSKDLLEESIMDLMNQGFFQQFFMIQASIRQKIKEKLPSTKQLNVEQLQEIVQYQLSIIKDNPQKLMKFITNLMSSQDQEIQQMAPLAINTIIADLVYEKYQIEEEDVIKVVTQPGVMNIPEIQNLMMQLEQSMFELMAPFNQQEYQQGY